VIHGDGVADVIAFGEHNNIFLTYLVFECSVGKEQKDNLTVVMSHSLVQ
jgi:hypothetical protein